MRDLDTLLNSLVNSEIVKGRGRQTAYDCPTVTHSNGGTLSRRLLALLYRATQGAVRRRPRLFERVLVGPVARDILPQANRASWSARLVSSDNSWHRKMSI